MAVSAQEAFAKVKSGEWSTEEAQKQSPDYAKAMSNLGPLAEGIVTPGGGAVGDALEDVFDPGQDDREKAAREAKEAQVGWDEFQQRYNAGEFTGPELGVGGEGPGQMRDYETGPMQTAREVKFLDTPGARMRAGLAPTSKAVDEWGNLLGSEWAGKSSAFEGMGPSAYSEMGPSAYDELGPSAFSDLEYDSEALSGLDASRDYYGDLMTSGNDPIAEADYQRRVAAAEGSRRANTDAALAQLEQRGQGNANAGLLADLSNQQASVSDQYLAGLDANAMAAARRDSAAGANADVSAMRGQGMLAADTARAGGMDAFDLESAGGRDMYAGERARGMDAYGVAGAQGRDAFSGAQYSGMDASRTDMVGAADDFENARYDEYYGTQESNADRGAAVDNRNMDRTWGTMDASTDLYNNAQYYNAVTRPGTRFDQQGSITSGGSNARLGAANTYSNNAKMVPDWGGRILQAGANYATANAGKPGA